jgi:hypothetical protein
MAQAAREVSLEQTSVCVVDEAGAVVLFPLGAGLSD